MEKVGVCNTDLRSLGVLARLAADDRWLLLVKCNLGLVGLGWHYFLCHYALRKAPKSRRSGSTSSSVTAEGHRTTQADSLLAVCHWDSRSHARMLPERPTG